MRYNYIDFLLLFMMTFSYELMMFEQELLFVSSSLVRSLRLPSRKDWWLLPLGARGRYQPGCPLVHFSDPGLHAEVSPYAFLPPGPGRVFRSPVCCWHLSSRQLCFSSFPCARCPLTFSDFFFVLCFLMEEFGMFLTLKKKKKKRKMYYIHGQ